MMDVFMSNISSGADSLSRPLLNSCGAVDVRVSNASARREEEPPPALKFFINCTHVFSEIVFRSGTQPDDQPDGHVSPTSAE